MALIDRESLVCIGRVADAHGLAGELKVRAVTDDPGYYNGLPALYLDTPRGLRHMKVAEMRGRNGGWTVRLEGLTGRTEAEALRGADVLVEPGQVKPLGEDEYFTRDLVGCRVVTVKGQDVGRVTAVIETAAQPLLQVEGPAGETLVPMVDGILTAVDVQAQLVTIDPPPGLLPEGLEHVLPDALEAAQAPGPEQAGLEAAGLKPTGSAAGAVRMDVLTLFPELFGPFLAEGLLGRAVENGLLKVEVVNFRQYGLGKHKSVDDVPYGGGAGMVLRPEPLFAAVKARREAHRAEGRASRVVLLTPQGRPFRQAEAAALARRVAGQMDGREGKEALIWVCGRYEGFDERIRTLADEELSIGDFVTLGGETPAMAMMEAVVRLLPGVLGNPASSQEESFAAGRLEYPQYTRPPEYEGMAVPEILLSGHHGEIARWRAAQAQERTATRRPDLMTRNADDDAADRPETTPGRTKRSGAKGNRSRRP